MNYIPKDAHIKKVAVIGAGASGLVAAKEALAVGFDVTVFEQSDNIGGIWYYKDHEAHSSVYKSTYINTTKEMMAFSDFPMPESFPVFCHHTQVMEYFNAYAEHFNLREHIRFNTQVLSITPSEPVSEDWTRDPQKWHVKYIQNKEDYTPLYMKETIDQNDAIVEEFDAVMVCTGHHTVPRWPKPAIEGMNTFKGPMIHSHSYKDVSNPLDLANKRVLVVGIGNSAVDIACEISRVTKQTYLSTRTGAWVVPKYLGGTPSGYKLPSRSLRQLPRRLITAVSEMIIKQHQGSMSKWGLDPHCRLDQVHPTVSQDLLGRIGHGSIIVRPGIERIDENSVVFVDGSSQELDAIIFCTGYDIKFSFLDDSILRVSPDNDIDVYKYVFLPAQSPTISMVGLVQQVGALMPISELQSRWICQVLLGNVGLPSHRKMLADISAKKTAIRNRYLARARHTIQVDAPDYMDELAAQFGAMPKISRHPRVMSELLFGPILPVHYRLDGPGAWPDAEKCLKKLVADIKQKM